MFQDVDLSSTYRQWRNFGLKSEGTKQYFWLGVGGPSSHSKKWGPDPPSPWN